MSPIMSLGTTTRFGEIVAVLWIGERYYLCIDRHHVVSLIPAFMVEVRDD